MFEKMIPLKKIVLDPKFYPRKQPFWQATQRYKMAMMTGADFPPIMVGMRGDNFVIIDGWHRCEARRQLKYEGIKAEITNLPEDEWFAESVRLNCKDRSLTLSMQETVGAIERLKEEGRKENEISEIVRVPPATWKRWLGERVVKTDMGHQVILKAPVVHLSRQDKKIPYNIEEATESFQSSNQMQMLDGVISLFQNNLLDRKNPKVVAKIIHLKKLLADFKVGKR